MKRLSNSRRGLSWLPARSTAPIFAATDDAGVPDAVANQLIETLGSEIDFHRDLRKGDRFALIYETLTHRGQTIRSGRLLAAEIRNNPRLLQAYWFQPEHAEGAYYTWPLPSLDSAATQGAWGCDG